MNRYYQLDSLRGLAALSVVNAHAITMVADLPAFLNYSPLRIVFSAHEAVLMFFY